MRQYSVPDPHLLVAQLALAVACLHSEFLGEDVGQLGTIPVTPASDLQRTNAILGTLNSPMSTCTAVSPALTPSLAKSVNCIILAMHLAHCQQFVSVYGMCSTLRHLLLIIIVVGGGQQVAKDKLRHIYLLHSVDLHRDASTIIEHGDGSLGLQN
mgnify:CR=1 FL=1